MRNLGKFVVIGVFAVVLTSVVWTAVFIATGRRLEENATTLVALASLGIGFYARRWLAARSGGNPSGGVAENAAQTEPEPAVKPAKETKRKGRGRKRRD